MERLEVGRPKNRIVEKLLVMGLVQDKKELRKKRVGKSREVRGEFCNFIKLFFPLKAGINIFLYILTTLKKSITIMNETLSLLCF